MMDVCTSPEAKRYRLYLLALCLVFLVTIFAATWMLENLDLGSGPRLALSLAPVFLWGIMILLVVKIMRCLDELQRRIHFEALAIAFPASLMVGLAVEYLQKADFAKDWTVGDVWPWMLLLYVPAYLFATWRYR